jgi:hypothetical protein
MTDRPILFSAPMIRALLDGRKTQTRRVLKPPYGTLEMTSAGWRPIFTKCFVGDRLWVREAWRSTCYSDEIKPRDLRQGSRIWHEVDGKPKEVSDGKVTGQAWGKLRPSIFMPRWASRLTLTVTDVRVQRLQEISASDCIEEGIDPQGGDHEEEGLIYEFETLWDSINAKRGFGWNENPWVVAYTFKVDPHNIDKLGK